MFAWGFVLEPVLAAISLLARARSIRIRRSAESDEWWAPLLEIAAYILAYAILMLVAWIADRIATRRHEREAPETQRQMREARRIIANRVR